MAQRKLIFFIVLLCSGTLFGQTKKNLQIEEGTFTDPRDNQVYKTITFTRVHHGKEVRRTWYAENVKYYIEGSLVYNNTSEYEAAYGRLYNYEQANRACPEGWHVPTIIEWKHLFHYFGGVHHSGKYLVAGMDSHLDLLFGGFGNPDKSYEGIGEHGNWWDNELKDDRSAGIITIAKDDDEIYHSRVGDRYFLSCRCVQFHN